MPVSDSDPLHGLLPPDGVVGEYSRTDAPERQDSLKLPSYGSRRIGDELEDRGYIVKYKDIYPGAYETPLELRNTLAQYFGLSNTGHHHTTLHRRKPDIVYSNEAAMSDATWHKRPLHSRGHLENRVYLICLNPKQVLKLRYFFAPTSLYRLTKSSHSDSRFPIPGTLGQKDYTMNESISITQ